MQITGKIATIAVTEEKKVLSLRIHIDDTRAGTMLEDIRKLKGISQKFTLFEKGDGNKLFFTGKIHSINIMKGLSLILHAEVVVPVLLKALELMGKPVYVRFTTKAERELLDLLKAAARMESIEPEEVLFRLTTFTSNGKLRQGKRSVFDLSDSQRAVVVSKLHKTLSTPGMPAT